MENKITPERVTELLSAQRFTFAKTMPQIPHYWTHRKDWFNDVDFCDVVMFIREWGIKEKWSNRTFIYYYANGYKYWTMNEQLSYTDKKKTFILNRCDVSEEDYKKGLSLQNRKWKMGNQRGIDLFE